MSEPHRIRLRGPWEVQPLARWSGGDRAASATAPALPPGTRSNMPADWSDHLGRDFCGRVRYIRHFGLPSGLDRQQVWIVCDGAADAAQVTLNDQPLGTIAAPDAPARFEVTRLLQVRNILIIDVEYPAPGDGIARRRVRRPGGGSAVGDPRLNASRPSPHRPPLDTLAVRAALFAGMLIGAAELPITAPARAADNPAAAAPSTEKLNQLTDEEIADGWLLLFDGETMFGWQKGSDANWSVADGVISASAGEPGLLHTTSEFADFQLRVDFRHRHATNSGVFLRTAAKPTDPAADCYELNIAEPPVSPFPTGSFVARQKATVDPSGEAWHRFDVTAMGDHFVVRLDEREVLDYHDAKPLGRGYIGLQFKEGGVEFRNVKLKPLSLQSIFNGRDLAGWSVLPDKKSVFSVTSAGELSIKNGNGALESAGRYGDFVLRLEVRTGGRGLNSGIFFRSVPGEFWQGYESQIQNACKNDDRTQPADCGSGGFYRRQDARRIVADDLTWFSDTLVVSGATWRAGSMVIRSATGPIRASPTRIRAKGCAPPQGRCSCKATIPRPIYCFAICRLWKCRLDKCRSLRRCAPWTRRGLHQGTYVPRSFAIKRSPPCR